MKRDDVVLAMYPRCGGLYVAEVKTSEVVGGRLAGLRGQGNNQRSQGILTLGDICL